MSVVALLNSGALAGVLVGVSLRLLGHVFRAFARGE